MTWRSTSFAGTSVSSWYAVVADALVLLVFRFRALARGMLGACPCWAPFTFSLVFDVSAVAPRWRAFLLVRPPDFLAPGLVVLLLFVPVSLLVFLVSSDYGLSFGVLSAGRCLECDVRLFLCSGRRVHPDGLTELALWRSFSNSSSTTSIY